MSQPKISGRIVIAAFGHLNDPHIVREPTRTVTLWVCLSNSRDIPVGIVDYKLDVYIDGSWRQMAALYQKIENFQLEFEEPSSFGPNKKLVFPTDNSFLMHEITVPITRTAPRGGLLVFLSPISELKGNIEILRLTIFDGYGGKHVIEQVATQIHDPSVLLRLVPDLRIEEITK